MWKRVATLGGRCFRAESLASHPASGQRQGCRFHLAVSNVWKNYSLFFPMLGTLKSQVDPQLVEGYTPPEKRLATKYWEEVWRRRKMTDKKLTLGQAIDQIIEALDSLEQNARQTAINAACSHLGMKPAGTTAGASMPQPTLPHPQPPSANPTPQIHTPVKRIDIRTLKEEKNPNSVKQMACVVA